MLLTSLPPHHHPGFVSSIIIRAPAVTSRAEKLRSLDFPTRPTVHQHQRLWGFSRTAFSSHVVRRLILRPEKKQRQKSKEKSASKKPVWMDDETSQPHNCALIVERRKEEVEKVLVWFIELIACDKSEARAKKKLAEHTKKATRKAAFREQQQKPEDATRRQCKSS